LLPQHDRGHDDAAFARVVDSLDLQTVLDGRRHGPRLGFTRQLHIHAQQVRKHAEHLLAEGLPLVPRRQR
jgi:hypothetical protein